MSQTHTPEPVTALVEQLKRTAGIGISFDSVSHAQNSIAESSGACAESLKSLSSTTEEKRMDENGDLFGCGWRAWSHKEDYSDTQMVLCSSEVPYHRVHIFEAPADHFLGRILTGTGATYGVLRHSRKVIKYEVLEC